MTYQIAGGEDFAPKTETVQLPSQAGTDKAVRLKKPDQVGLIENLPDVLSGIVAAGMKGQSTEFDLNKETVPDLMRALNVVAIECFVEPKLHAGDEMDAGRVPVKWIQFQDKVWVFNWALGEEYPRAESFRGEQSADVRALPADNGVAAAAERSAAAGA